jgi:hypothetical protein
MTEEPTTHRPYRVVPDPWGDLSIATLRRGLLSRAAPDPGGGAARRGPVRLLAVLDDGTFVVADAGRTHPRPTVRAVAA